MSLEKEFIVHDTHSKSITAIGCSPSRREIYLGFEDGVVKSIEIDTKNHILTYWEHRGWITAFLYWPVSKLLFCSSNDAVISVIGSGGILVDKIYVGQAIYSMVLNNRRKEVILGVNGGLQFHQLFEVKEGFSHYIDPKPTFVIHEHKDIVRCVVVLDSRIYSTGYDGALVIYDCHFTGHESAVKNYKNARAHDAGISCLLVEKDVQENNIWVFTGSFDKSLKIWTGDGKIIHKFSSFVTGVTGICYVPKNKTICCVAGSNTATIYDPKSGEEVTDFIDTFVEESHGNHYLHLLKYLNEFNLMLATTSRKQLIVYKYNPNGCLTSLKYKQILDSICFTSKVPILIFTGDSAGTLTKWEQRQSNQLIYGSENLIKSEIMIKEASKTYGVAKPIYHNSSNESRLEQENRSYGQNDQEDLMQIKKTNTVLKLLFLESLDLIFAACEDASIYVWGFDDDAVKILKNMKYKNNEDSMKIENEFDYFNSYFKTLSRMNNDVDVENPLTNETMYEENNGTNKKEENDSVTNRVAGFILKKVLSEHTSCVTALAVVERLDIYPCRFLISSGWDRRICIWDLERLKLFDIFKNTNTNVFEEVELASDGNILDMCYCEKKNVFAYATTDSMCYIRKFSMHGSEMVLVDTLQGHLSEVNCIKWNGPKSNWITGGEDGTVRIWSENCECIQIVNCNGAVNSLCIDPVQEVLMVAAHDMIKVYEMRDYHLVQTNIGHLDSIRDLIFIPERGHIVSVSWDKTIKVWRSYRKQNQTRKKIENDKDKKFETWVWDQMKVAMKTENSFDLASYSDRLNYKRDSISTTE